LGLCYQRYWVPDERAWRPVFPFPEEGGDAPAD